MIDIKLILYMLIIIIQDWWSILSINCRFVKIIVFSIYLIYFYNRMMNNITPSEAFKMLKHEEKTLLVDVRTTAEWMELVPDVPKDKFCALSIYEGNNRTFNESFVENFTMICPDKDVKVFFICKSGGRSLEATNLISMSGYKNCYNISGGFEEWKKSNLPYKTGI